MKRNRNPKALITMVDEEETVSFYHRAQYAASKDDAEQGLDDNVPNPIVSIAFTPFCVRAYGQNYPYCSDAMLARVFEETRVTLGFSLGVAYADLTALRPKSHPFNPEAFRNDFWGEFVEAWNRHAQKANEKAIEIQRRFQDREFYPEAVLEAVFYEMASVLIDDALAGNSVAEAVIEKLIDLSQIEIIRRLEGYPLAKIAKNYPGIKLRLSSATHFKPELNIKVLKNVQWQALLSPDGNIYPELTRTIEMLASKKLESGNAILKLAKVKLPRATSSLSVLYALGATPDNIDPSFLFDMTDQEVEQAVKHFSSDLVLTGQEQAAARLWVQDVIRAKPEFHFEGSLVGQLFGPNIAVDEEVPF